MTLPLLWMLLACQTEPAGTTAAAAPEPPADLPETLEDEADAPTSAFEAPEADKPHPAADVDRVAARHVLISFVGAAGKPLGVNRSRDEALVLAESVLAKLQAGEDFAALAKAHSDDASKRRGGFLGSGSRGSWVKPFEDAVWALQPGEISGVVESEFGFHVIRREVLQEAHVRHIVVQHQGARNVAATDPGAGRTPAAARARVEEALAALEAGQPFEEVAKQYSDGPMGKRGGDLGWFVRGDLGPAFDEAVFSLEAGQRSGIVESPFGLHVIERVE